MIERVYRQAAQSKSLTGVIVATDHPAIEEEVKRFGGEVCLTSPDHPSGTDRCAEVVDKLNLACDAIVNIQGDEPFIDPKQIELVCDCFKDERTELATLVKKISTQEVLLSPNSPKVVIDHDGFAIYFSRHPIPYLRNAGEGDWLNYHVFYQHIGIYGYTREVLRKITQLPPSSLEQAEALEQLRWVENGFRIKTAETTFETVAIDTPDDLEKVAAAINTSD